VNTSLIDSIRGNYDRLAEEYTRNLADELKNKPLDRELLERFAGLTAGRGQVCDLGCGPGHVARYLRDLGTDVFGLDLSPQMIAAARQVNPGICFQIGNMMALNLETNQLAGIAAFYSIVNLPKDLLSIAFQEMHRVLQAEGVLLLAFHIGNQILSPDELWGVPVAMDWFFFRTSEIKQLLETEGFFIEEVIEREPYHPDVEHQSRRAYVFARKRTISLLHV
jgi:SAM-dependent methyltransferase